MNDLNVIYGIKEGSIDEKLKVLIEWNTKQE